MSNAENYDMSTKRDAYWREVERVLARIEANLSAIRQDVDAFRKAEAAGENRRSDPRSAAATR